MKLSNIYFKTKLSLSNTFQNETVTFQYISKQNRHFQIHFKTKLSLSNTFQNKTVTFQYISKRNRHFPTHFTTKPSLSNTFQNKTGTTIHFKTKLSIHFIGNLICSFNSTTHSDGKIVTIPETSFSSQRKTSGTLQLENLDSRIHSLHKLFPPFIHTPLFFILFFG